ncbi:MAG: ABC transporter substrate-binding protein [Rhizobiaceae bacterium]|nr:ABC transporter substrate-binding protein [Rhizobiaceae bacterium]|tara:strand:- start:62185 stop:63129 length:945 start_codon:yes stop_codon:yes gene_type:complete
MFTRRTIIGLLAATTMMGSASFAVAQEKPYIALVSKGFQHQFWQAVKIGAEQAAEEFDVTVTFEGPDGEGAVDRQLDMISAAMAKKPSALGIAAIDSQATVPLLKRAQKDGIPVIAFDSGVASDIPVATASTDNLASAALAADKLAELIGGSGKVAIVSFDQTSQTGIERRDGFVDQMKSAHPDVEIVSIEYGGGDHLKSAEITKTLLQAYPDLKGIFGTNEGSAIGVAIGKKESGSDVVVIGYDSGKAQTDAIRDGTIAGAITQNPVGIGYETVKAGVAAAKGQSVPKHIDTGFYYYDKSNIDDPKIAAVLYD